MNSFTKSIDLISFFGFEKKFQKLTKLKKVKNIFFKPKLYSSIVKKRFIDTKSNYKMFGSYIIDLIDRNFDFNIIYKK